ncbi:MAG TPA: chromosome segregation protein SMC [Polyangiaceae bacterium]|nr:chromosome segregation protein SMC [Polyangiaceae bacterium]
MHIKRLEIAGFKSFVDRTVIQFDHDVVAIVGPNGCGKSNIDDAIRWCLGEQSARHLRGRSMEDVLFNGSESRGPHGLAEVTITFDNTNQDYANTLPPEFRDYPDIAVTRRLFRDGTSEYLINKTQVRLRDVTELFLGTGVGTKAYSIVEQGRIGQIVSARPEDRRLFIDEAAGVTKYKQRRKLAERKMDLTRQNLLRVTDIVSEIDKNRASLKRQAAKAERFIEYRRELEDLVLLDASHKFLELTVTQNVERDGHVVESQAAGDARTKLRDAEALLDATRAEASGIEAANDEAARLAFEADNHTSSLAAQIDRSKERLAHLDLRLTTGNAELEVIAGRSAQLSAEQTQLTARIEELGSDERARQADTLSETEALTGLHQEEAAASAEVLKFRQETGELGARVAAQSARIDGLSQRLDENRARRDRVVSEREALDGEVADASAREQALERSVAEAAHGKSITASEREALEREVLGLKSGLLDSERTVDVAKNDLSLTRSRLRALEDLHRRLEGVGAGARALLGKDDSRVLGLVADHIEVPEELTTAVAGLLGGLLQCVVVESREAGVELLEDLRSTERGRAQVIAARPSGTREYAALPDEPGILGRLAERFIVAETDAALVRALVGDAVLTQTVADALRVSETHGITAVALDGTVVRPDGVVSGGAGDEVASTMLDQKREMQRLMGEVARLEANATRLSTEHNALRARIAELDTALERARQFAHEGELLHVTAQKDLARVKGDVERCTQRLAALANELGDIDRSIEEATRQDGESRTELDALKSRLEHVEHDLARAEATAATWRERVATQAGLVTERKVRLAQVREQADAARQSSERVGAALTELRGRDERLRQELHDAAAAYGETAGEMVRVREEKIYAGEAAKKAHEALDAARARLDQARQALSSHELELRGLRDVLELRDEAARKHELALQRIDLERQHLIGSIRERFRGLDLLRVVGDYHARPLPDDDQRRRIEELTQLIDRMGPVNLDAKTEHEQAEKRFHELNDQKVDIEKALVELESAIRLMNKESRRRFRETFDAVNALFKKTFARLFRGGRAELLLTDPEDLLGSGVEIIAQPPGKKLGNIELMSGGEKALTAASLIFAIFQHRPSPFCILDEVDAPLDEANVSRYNEMVRLMTTHSQFIVITHVKATMQAADVLYGVTMGEPGVSRLVSVKVNDSAVARSDTLAQKSGRAVGDGQSEAPTGAQVA